MSGFQLKFGARINGDAAFTCVQDKLREALSINTEQAIIIKSLNNDITRQQQVEVRIEAENDVLISGMQCMIKEKRKLHSTHKAKSRFDQDKLEEARDINSGHALMIKSLNDDIDRQQRVVNQIYAENEKLENLIKENKAEHALIIKSLNNASIIRQNIQLDEGNKSDAENEALISDMQYLIEENQHLTTELHSTTKANNQLDEANNMLRNENFALLDELESKRLGWLEESEVEELKWQTKEPLIRKLEASQEETKQLEELIRSLDAERDRLVDKLVKAADRITELSSAVIFLPQTIDKICQENLSLKARIRSFDSSATFCDTPIPPMPHFKKQASGQQKSSRMLAMIPSIPSFFQDLLSTSTQDRLNLNRATIRRQTCPVQSAHGSNVTQIPTKRSSNMYETVNQAQQLFEAENLSSQRAIPTHSDYNNCTIRRQTFPVQPAHGSDVTHIPTERSSNIYDTVNQTQQLFEAENLSKSTRVDDFGDVEDDTRMRRNNVADAVDSMNQIGSAPKKGGVKVHDSNGDQVEDVVTVQKIATFDKGEKYSEKLNGFAKLGHRDIKEVAESLALPSSISVVVYSRAADFESELPRSTGAMEKNVSRPGLAASKTYYLMPSTLPNSSKPGDRKIHHDLSITQQKMVKSIVAKGANALTHSNIAPVTIW